MKDSARLPTKEQRLASDEVNITAEARYIITSAQAGKERVVSLSPLVFFSTQTGDAWMLDPQEGFALCLAENGEEQSYEIVETPNNFKIEWQAQYHIEGDQFIIITPGKVSTRSNYPVKEIGQLAVTS